jgi:hypothetical protein
MKKQFCFNTIHQQLSGAAEARRAHNPEGNGSKPFSAITFVFVFHDHGYRYMFSFLIHLLDHCSQKLSFRLLL